MATPADRSLSSTTRCDVSPDDELFRARVEDRSLPIGEFDHRAHVRLAYVYVADYGVDAGCELMREALQRLLAHNQVDPLKYHETITRAWILAVAHRMEQSGGCASADEFIDANAELLDTSFLLRHYSAALLASDEARIRFAEPDVTPIA